MAQRDKTDDSGDSPENQGGNLVDVCFQGPP